jgi:hypothetical protein
MEHFKLAVENLKRDARHTIGLNLEQVTNLAQQTEPIAMALANLKSKVKAIRGDARLSDGGKTTDVSTAKSEAATHINDLAQQIGRHAVIVDMNQRIATKVTGARERAKAAMGADAALLAQELRLHVIPRLLNEAKMQQIPSNQALGKMARRAAEGYAESPVKAEIVLQACTTGWPWVQGEVDGETLAQVNDLIAGQVAGEEQGFIIEAQAVQGLLDRVVNAAMQTVREQK